MPTGAMADVPTGPEEAAALQATAQWHAVGIFRVFYCCAIAGVICMHHFRHASFYRWFVGSGLQQEQRRGLGYAAVRPYGLFEPPRLSVAQFHAVGAALVASLLLACLDGFAPQACLWCAFCLYFLYFPQLFCESKAGGHSSVMIPTTLFMLALARPNTGAAWPLEMLKVYLALSYCASGFCKLAGSVYFKRFWGSGTTLQCYIYEAMWTRPANRAPVRKAQELLLCSPYFCTALGIASLIFEAGFPAVLLMPHWLAALLGAGASLSFHAGIELLMGLDFLSYWCPVLLAFVAEDAAALASAAAAGKGAAGALSAAAGSFLSPPAVGAVQAVQRGFAAEPVAVVAAFVYLLGQILVSFSLRDILGEEKLPFSCCPMFFFPRNLFSSTPKLFCLSGANWRKAGFLDCSWLYNKAFPPPFELRDEDMSRLQFPIVTFGSLNPMPEDLSFRVKPKYRGQPFVLFANVEVGSELRTRLEELMRQLQEGSESDAWRTDKLLRVLELQKECRALFAATPWTPPQPLQDGTSAPVVAHGKTE